MFPTHTTPNAHATPTTGVTFTPYRRPTLLLALMGLSLLFGCVQHPPQPHTSGMSDPLTYTINTSLALEPSQRLPYLQAQLGQPGQVLTEQVPNLHDTNQQDTFRTYRYESVTLSTYTVASTTEEHLVRLDVQATGYTAPNGAQIGRQLSAIQNDLPVFWHDDQVTAYLLPHPDGAPDTLVLSHADQAVTRISIELYID